MLSALTVLPGESYATDGECQKNIVGANARVSVAATCESMIDVPTSGIGIWQDWPAPTGYYYEPGQWEMNGVFVRVSVT